MALTSDQITAQNFKDFYTEIRPYLNGNVPTFANTFNKSDLYSADEQLVGRWVNGKPLYQKTINLGTMTNNKSVVHGISNIDMIIKVTGFAYLSSGQHLELNFINLSNSFYATLIADKTNISILASGVTDRQGYATIQYTKSTDSSMSVSDGNEYSLDEQVVGHWIDGKILYQKTIDVGALPNNTTKEVTAGISNMDQLVRLTGTMSDASDSYAIPQFNSTLQWILSVWYRKSTDKIIMMSTKDYSTYNGYVTLQYTKTI